MNTDASNAAPTGRPPRPAWVEVDLAALAQNFCLIRADLPAGTRLLYVAKDDAYGIGAVRASEVALAHGTGGILSTHATVLLGVDR